MLNRIAISTVLSLSLIACKSEAKQVSQPLVQHDIPVDSALWIDVRSQSEFDSGHLPEAIHIPFQHIGENIAKVTTSKRQVIKLYCSVGGRSGIALRTLNRLGYTNVTNEGGYADILRRRKQK